MRKQKCGLLVSVMVYENTQWTIIHSRFLKNAKEKKAVDTMVELLKSETYNGEIIDKNHERFEGVDRDIQETELWYYNDADRKENIKILSVQYNQFYQ